MGRSGLSAGRKLVALTRDVVAMNLKVNATNGAGAGGSGRPSSEHHRAQTKPADLYCVAAARSILHNSSVQVSDQFLRRVPPQHPTLDRHERQYKHHADKR